MKLLEFKRHLPKSVLLGLHENTGYLLFDVKEGVCQWKEFQRPDYKDDIFRVCLVKTISKTQSNKKNN